MSIVNGHAEACGWQFEQYPHECDCGVILDKQQGTVTMPMQLFEAMTATLYRKEQVFRDYALLHSEKGTDEGIRKAERNAQHGQDIDRVLGRLDGHTSVSLQPIPNIFDELDIAYERVVAKGKLPVAFIITPDVGDHLSSHWRKVRAELGIRDFHATGALSTARYMDCEIIVSPSGDHSFIICCAEGSEPLRIVKEVKYGRD